VERPEKPPKTKFSRRLPLCSDAKCGQNLEAEVEAEARATRPRPRPISGG